MERKAHLDQFGTIALTAFALNLAVNQVVVKVTNGGLEPVFAAGLRSVGAVMVLTLWMWWRGVSLRLSMVTLWAGVLSGVLFAAEFTALFTAIDLSTVSRVSIIFYSMPVWLALGAHVLLPGEALTGKRALGLLLAMSGVVLAIFERDQVQVSWLGDALALFAAMCWAAIALGVRLTPLAKVPPAQQLYWQLIVSAPILLLLAPLFGPLVRDIAPIHLVGLAYQIIAVASLGFLAWFWLMSVYPANTVASFSFLSPVFAVILGWLVLDEQVGVQIWAALGLVAAGIFLINRR
ncbi:putative cystine transporter YijE [Ascidiaceihabitans donghaensis]|uniref:Putative cystine transporter YijE n=1 Tax=Ascidiaceihabitans donghaensis TaxID=1510460 RepID=A0A2R8BER2_9RHOB|nr:DMT family transporter [Ascidiaceihabitans donghaensis]SPH21590.1 putative cystine transporter YijE [Ascidiaceihabitans donghaensis]